MHPALAQNCDLFKVLLVVPFNMLRTTAHIMDDCILASEYKALLEMTILALDRYIKG